MCPFVGIAGLPADGRALRGHRRVRSLSGVPSYAGVARSGWQAILRTWFRLASKTVAHMITLYILQSLENSRRYIGMTNNLQRRLHEHCARKTKGGQQLKSFKLIHTETFPDYTTARAREKFLKTGAGREWVSRQMHQHGLSGNASPFH